MRLLLRVTSASGHIRLGELRKYLREGIQLIRYCFTCEAIWYEDTGFRAGSIPRYFSAANRTFEAGDLRGVVQLYVSKAHEARCTERMPALRVDRNCVRTNPESIMSVR